MSRKIIAIVFSLIMVLFIISFAWGFGSDANYDTSTSDPTDQRPYTRANAEKPADQGGYKGGHDTIMTEAMLLKKKVHEKDADGGTRFNNEMVNKALPNLRTGAHDEDSKKWMIFGYLGSEAPIGMLY